MSWPSSKSRLEQCYIYVGSWLNDCGIRPDGAEIKPWVREETEETCKKPSTEEVQSVLYAMYQDGVQFYSGPGSAAAFDKHPELAATGFHLKLKT